MEIVSLVFVLLSLPLLWSGMLNLFYIPLSLVFELRRRYEPTHVEETTALVSIVVPAYNEGRVIVACVESILACPYPRKEIILVNDGSTDDTLAQMQRFRDYENVVIIDKPNGGKASALNAGLARAGSLFSASMPMASSQPTPSMPCYAHLITHMWVQSAAATNL